MAEDFKPHLRTYLRTSTELTTLVGSRLYWDETPQEVVVDADGIALPFVFLRRQGSSVIDQDDVRDRARVQVICEAVTPELATAAYLALNTALHQKQNYTAGTITVRSSMRSAGPMDDINRITGRPQVVAYYTVRY